MYAGASSGKDVASVSCVQSVSRGKRHVNKRPLQHFTKAKIGKSHTVVVCTRLFDLE